MAQGPTSPTCVASSIRSAATRKPNTASSHGNSAADPSSGWAPSSGSYTSSKLIRRSLRLLLRSPLHLLAGDVLDVRRDRPFVSPRIEQRAASIAVELIDDRALLRGAEGDGAGEDFIDVLDVDGKAARRAAERLRADLAHLGMLVGEHEVRAADLQVGVRDAAVHRKALDLFRAEGRLVELDRVRRAAHEQVRGDAVVPIRNCLDHGVSLVLENDSGRGAHLSS